MMASALIGISCDDHIRHHIVDFYALFLDWVEEEVLEVGEEDGIFQSLFLVPMAIPLVFWGFSGGRSADLEGEGQVDVVGR